LNNFIDFLYLFGHFVSIPRRSYGGSNIHPFLQAGEDLEDDDDEEKEEDEEATFVAGPSGTSPDGDLSASQLSEQRPLLGSRPSRSMSRSRRRRASLGPHGDATVTQAVLMVPSYLYHT
jgi:proton-coupled amino acid transporter